MIGRLAILVCALVLAWGLLVVPARLLWGDSMVLLSLVALGLCLAPAAATMLWLGVVRRQAPEMFLVHALGGTGVRLAVVLGGGLALFLSLPETFSEVFWVWVLVFYMLSLVLEVTLVVQARKVDALPNDHLRHASGTPAGIPRDAVGGDQSV